MTSSPRAAMPRPIRTRVLPIQSSTTEGTDAKRGHGFSSRNTVPAVFALFTSVTSVVGLLDQVDAGEEVSDFDRGRLWCIRSMRRIPFDRLGELLPERAGIGLRRVRRA